MAKVGRGAPPDPSLEVVFGERLEIDAPGGGIAVRGGARVAVGEGVGRVGEERFDVGAAQGGDALGEGTERGEAGGVGSAVHAGEVVGALAGALIAALRRVAGAG